MINQNRKYELSLCVDSFSYSLGFLKAERRRLEKEHAAMINRYVIWTQNLTKDITYPEPIKSKKLKEHLKKASQNSKNQLMIYLDSFSTMIGFLEAKKQQLEKECDELIDRLINWTHCISEEEFQLVYEEIAPASIRDLI